MESQGAIYPLPQSALPRVPSAAPSFSGLPWSRVGEIVIFTFVAVLALYLLWLWVLRDLIFIVKARRGRSTEELQFGDLERAPPVPSADGPPSVPAPSCPAQPRSPFLG
ncbi:movement protein [Urochloa streak virus]|uniref:Movement protein n=1 Tax=Urochloa streak virus TaxID=520848 RepID=B3FVZ6_9GEMI|nr:movement protein [Urochloa streak virus]ACC68184.1 movement protein [Urochloa streak virus]ACC68193.1 movement protein [Urochloa streak virus]